MSEHILFTLLAADTPSVWSDANPEHDKVIVDFQFVEIKTTTRIVMSEAHAYDLAIQIQQLLQGRGLAREDAKPAPVDSSHVF